MDLEHRFHLGSQATRFAAPAPRANCFAALHLTSWRPFPAAQVPYQLLLGPQVIAHEQFDAYWGLAAGLVFSGCVGATAVLRVDERLPPLASRNPPR